MAGVDGPGARAGATGAGMPGNAKAAGSTAIAHETSDDYGRVVTVLAPGWRVVVCKDEVQWIIQRRKKGGARRPWRGVAYCRTRKALTRLCAASCSPLDPSAKAALDALPEVFGRAGR